MSDETLQDALQPEETPVPDQNSEQPEEQAQQKQETERKNNFEELRKQKARLERERDEAYARLKEYEAQKAKPKEEQEDASYFGLSESDIVEGKHLKAVNKEIKRLRDELSNYQQKSAEMTTEARLKAQYSDFDTVVSPENINALRDSYPEIAQTLNSSPDLYSKAVSAYTLIKKLGIHQPDLYAAERSRAQENAAKPRPSASLSPQSGDTPLTHANAFAEGLTPDLRKKLWSEMEEARKRR